jgi:N-acetylmuramoyl-L-alanine amidase
MQRQIAGMEWLTALLAALVGLIGHVVAPQDGSNPQGVTIALDPVRGDAARLPLPPVEGPAGTDRPLVVLDPGHGGRDPGAISPGGQREKDVTLGLARSIRDALVASGRVRVAITRNDDTYLILRDRYEIARRLKADLFISIHADAAPNPGASGATIYTLSEVASDQEAALLAARENKADLIGGVNLGGQDATVDRILIDLAQRESMEVSTKFASLLYREASGSVPFRPVPHAFAAFAVLKAPDIPSILFEAGYLTHDKDLAYIASPAGREQIAAGMRRAIEAHFARRIAASRPPALRSPGGKAR